MHRFPLTRILTAVLLSLLGALAAAAEKAAVPGAGDTQPKLVDVAKFVERDAFEQLKISPSGEYLAASVPIEDKSVLVIMRRADMTRTAVVNVKSRTFIEDFWWVNDERVLITFSEKHGAFDRRYRTGEIFATDANGKNQSLLIGWRRGEQAVNSRIKSKRQEFIAGDMVDTLRDEDDHVLVAVTPLTAGEEPYTTLERLHVRTGARSVVARAPVRNGQFLVDHAGVARFAAGAGADLNSRLFYRSGPDAQWELINEEAKSGLDVYPMAFNADDSIAYLDSDQPNGPGAVMAFDTRTRRQTLLARDAKVDPAGMHLRADGRTPFAVRYRDGEPRPHFIDADAPESRLLKSLQKSFPGQIIEFTGFTRDGNMALVYVYSDRNPGDFYVFDITRKEATHLASRREWVDPERMSAMRPVSLTARDGRLLHGFLTVPAGSSGKDMPLVVNPHGGPFGVADAWGFGTESQLLASRGYAVLQVNFRGSGNHGREHLRAGYRQWGGAMQDDLADATRWAIGQGIADAKRICIYGASYGAYAALMGAAKDPDLYQCAVGYIGVYDLALMYQKGDIRDSRTGTNFLRETLGGDAAQHAKASPTRLAAQIKAPVFLAAGGIDDRAPIQHSEMMRDALTKAGNKPEWLVYPDEGHGFDRDEHNVEYYTRLLAFLDRHIGPSAGR